MARKYRKKPVVIKAVRFEDSPESIMELAKFMDQDVRVSYEDPDNPVVIIETLEGDHIARVGDYIIEGVAGEFYPCKPDIFEAIYDPA